MTYYRASEPVTLEKVTIRDEFWGRYMKLVREEIIPYQWNALNDNIPGTEPSHSLENFRIASGLSEGEFYGRVWQDSDVAKWLETVAYSLATHPDENLEEMADGVIALIGKAQQPDGYLNTYYTIKEPGKRWTNERDKHELYCAGHLMEAAVAYFNATGKRRILDIVCALADHIHGVFGPEDGKKHGYPGHQEIELALVKLYRATGTERYLKLAGYFIDERGVKPYYFDIEAKERGEEGDKGVFGEYSYPYRQSHLPVREQKAAVGHAVRAVYMYTGMADIAAETGDGSLAEACRTLWENVTKKQMYVTGGLGSQGYGEDFTFDYDLPNDTCYAETCASVGLAFWARSMQKLEVRGEYADIVELALYNGALSGMSLDGRKYFYVNPLEVWPDSCKARHDKRDVETTRQGWFNCACCPPNLARLTASLGGYVYSTGGSVLYVHLYMDNTALLDLNGQSLKISQKTGYPWNGNVTIAVDAQTGEEFTLAVRIPGWCTEASARINGRKIEDFKMDQGYLWLTRIWEKGDSLQLDLPMPVRRVQSHPELRENAGRVAIMRGPLVYCLEEADNSKRLSDISLAADPGFRAEFEEGLLGGVVAIYAKAYRTEDSSWEGALYRELDFGKKPVEIKAVPYYAWNNRGEGEMAVWIRQSEL